MPINAPWSLISRIPPNVIPHLIEDLTDVQITVYVAFVGYTILVWDHFITFSDEIEYIWKGSRGLLVYLYLLNRYSTPFIFILNLFAYLSPTWTPEVCRHFVRFEGATTVLGIHVTMLMMLIRVSALYDKRLVIIGITALCFCLELGVQAWLLTHGVPVIHDRAIHTCSMIFDSSVGSWASASAFLPLIYDTVILILTLNRTLGAVRQKTAGKIVQLLLRDGILYYSVIFAVTLVLTIMIASAPPGLQNIAAQLEYLLTVAMGSRIMLNLRKRGRKGHLHASISGIDSADTSSTISSTIRLRSIRTIQPPSNVDVSGGVRLEQTLVIHDDRGEVVDTQHPGPSKSFRIQNPDWFELTHHAPQPVRLVDAGRDGGRDSGNSQSYK